MNRLSLPTPLPLLAGAALIAGLLAPLLCTAQPAKPGPTAPSTAPAATATPNPAAAPAGGEGSVVTTSSGLVFKLIKQGTGPSPKASDTVKVHYRGTFLDGKEFDSSYSRGKPLEFPLNGVIKCWTEGVQRLQVGGSAKLTCPPAIAYGERGAGSAIPPNATLNFDVELLGIAGR
ncbi:MAG: FKBP-type peptidyl-prolyl cis-trans isomerase [Microbacteriaceae bacterium]|nr:FKBP-type peptidyl-prolyl cis-trans isomerase [Burkholderiaceae bacterium]